MQSNAMYIKMFSGTDVVRKQKETPLEVSLGDSNRTQTCNLLIRSQMLYSIELWSQLVGQLGLLIFSSVDFLADAGLLTGEVAEVEDTGAANLAILVNLDAVNERALEGKNPLNTNATGHFADGESFGERVHTTDLDHDTAELLKSLLITFLNSVGHGDGVTGLELRVGSNFLILESLLCNLNQIHNSLNPLCNIAVWLLTRGCVNFGTAKIQSF